MSLPVKLPVVNSSTPSLPKDFILHSFNVFNPDIILAPNNLFSQTSNYLKQPLTDDQITEQTFEQAFSSSYSEFQSFQESQSAFAATMGIEASYAFFSGSISASYEKDTYQASTAFSSSFTAYLDCGTITFRNPSDYKAIRECLASNLVADLDNIRTLNDAKNFTEKYGTHLILGVKLGGTIQLKTQAQTTDYSSQEKISLDVRAAFKSVFSISVAASVAQTLLQDGNTYNFKESVQALGGSSSLVAAVDPTDPKTINKWADSCTTNSACGITNTLEIWRLTENEQAKRTFQQFANLVILSQSLNNPTIFTSCSSLKVGTLVSTTAVANDPHFRIIGGGAAVDMNCNNFLVTSCPQLDTSTGEITGWTASSHDIDDPAQTNTYITSYAIAVYDPSFEPGSVDKLLEVIVRTAEGSNPNPGMDSATAKLDAGYILSGGGIKSLTLGPINKFIMSSYPSAIDSWTVAHSDYQSPASDNKLISFAIGIASAHPAINIKPVLVQTDFSYANHGMQTAELGEGLNIAGGGVAVENPNGMGNLVQQSYPSSSNSWLEYNKDLHSNLSYANNAAYAIGFAAVVNFDI